MYLCSEVLGSDNPKENVWGNIHQRIIKNLDNLEPDDECLTLIPRGHFKSTLITQDWSVQQLIKDPNKRILIASAKLEKAVEFTKTIKSHFDRNEKFIERFGKWESKTEVWTKEKFCIEGRRAGLREASVTAGSIGTDMTGYHFDIIILDDIVTREFVRSADMRDKTFSFYLDCLDLLDPGGLLIIVGTRWHFNDIYSEFLKPGDIEKFKFVINESAMENPKYERSQFEEMMNDKDTKLLFPERFSLKHFKNVFNKKTRKAGGYLEFACQQMNFPVSDPNASFRIEDIEFITELPVSASIYQTIDTAGSEEIKNRTDDTAIVTTGLDVNADIINIDCYAEKTTAEGAFTPMWDAYLTYKSKGIKKIGIETNFNAANTLYIKSNYPEMYRKLVPYKAGNKVSKNDRMLALKPYVHHGKFKMLQHDDKEAVTKQYGNKVIKLHPGQVKLLAQMIDFGMTKDDDALDAQSAVLQFAKRPRAASQFAVSYVPEDEMTGF